MTWLIHMSYMNQTGHIWKTRTIHEWVVSLVNESCHLWMTITAMSHILLSHIYGYITYDICDKAHWVAIYGYITYDWLPSLWMTHITHEWPCHILRLTCPAYEDESCHIYVTYITYYDSIMNIARRASCMRRWSFRISRGTPPEDPFTSLPTTRWQ